VTSYKDEIKERLREAIVTGQLRPGQRIVETEVARTFGISQVPVREALRGLEEEGLVRSVKYKGTYVADFELKEVYHTFLLRTQVEVNALSITLPNLTESHFNRLAEIVQRMREAAQETTYAEHSKLDVQFHGCLIEWSGIETYGRVWRMLSGHIQRFVALIHPNYFSENHQEVIRQHEELLEVLRTRQLVQVKKALSDHIMLWWYEYGSEWMPGEHV
jgi:DNA-binding GntR family transcriptional regulator